MRRIDCQAVAMQARGNRARLASSLAAAVAAFLLLAGGVRADQPVGITAEQPWLDVMHEGRLVRIRREPDNLNQIFKGPDHGAEHLCLILGNLLDMNKIIFTEEFCQPENLYPFTLTRQLQDIRVGILTIREKWEMMLGLPPFDKKEDDYKDLGRSVNIDEAVGNDVCLMIHGNVLPTPKLVKAILRLKDGEFIATPGGSSVAFRITKRDIVDKFKIKVGHAVTFKESVKTIQYPWDIFQLNDWAIRHDFALLTEKRKSQPLSKTNKVTKASQVFIEKGEVAHFDTAAVRAPRAWVLGANTRLPRDIALTWAREMPADFHARHRALSRSYCYWIVNRSERPALAAGRAAWVHRPLDVGRMNAAAAHLIGEHDFSAFRAAECQSKTPMRRVTALTVERAGDFVTIRVTANAFLHHMVRNISGLLLAVGRGDAAPAIAAEVLAARDRRRNAASAPAEGLYLTAISYPGEFGVPAAVSPMIPP